MAQAEFISAEHFKSKGVPNGLWPVGEAHTGPGMLFVGYMGTERG